MAKRKNTSPEDDKRYHNTLLLLQNYRNVVWSMELSVEQLRKEFEKEYGSSVEGFLDSVYMAGADLSGTEIESHARSIERSRKMLALVDGALNLLRTKHPCGEAYYWILYYSYFSSQPFENITIIVDHLRPYIRDISRATYFRKREDAITAMSSVLWGYTSRECFTLLSEFIPEAD